MKNNLNAIIFTILRFLSTVLWILSTCSNFEIQDGGCFDIMM